jgi:acyl-CoA synthetase (AMP-forming)/AMP-acid ligase II
MLAIFASDAIALPLSPAFPTGELKYILDNSQAKMLLTTEKYADKAMAVLREGLEHEPIFNVRNKLQGTSSESVTLKDLERPSLGGMMLYTSGTTNRPVINPPRKPRRDLTDNRKAFSSRNLH